MVAFIPLGELSTPSKVAIIKLCISNVVFVVLGLVAIGTGAYFSVQDNVFKFIASYIPGVPAGQLHNLLDSTTAEVISSACIILIAAGLGISVVSMVGFCGAIQRNQHCMLGYVVFLVVLVIAESAGLALFGSFRAVIDDGIEVTLRQSIGSQFRSGHGSGDGLTVTFAYLQVQYDCCGIKGVGDYSSTFDVWRRSYNASSANDTSMEAIPHPPYCCRFRKGRKPIWTKIAQFESTANWTKQSLVNFFRPYWQYPTCLDDTRASYQKAWTNKGCYRSFQSLIFGALLRMLLGVAITILVFEVLCLLASCILMCDVMSVRKIETKRDEKEAELKAERDTILAGIQATGSLAAFAMTGGMSPNALAGKPSMVTSSMSMMARGPAMSSQRMNPGTSKYQLGYSPSKTQYYY